MSRKTEFVWQKQSMVSELEVIDCPVLDPIKDFRRDPTGYYVLVRVVKSPMPIEVAICDKHHQIVKVFRGEHAVDIYESIFRYEKRQKVEWFSLKGHAAYLGKELKKAEIALERGAGGYTQE